MATKHNPGFLKVVEEARAHVKECSAAEVKARMDRGERFVLLDVREDHEWAVDRIVGAEHLGRGILERDAETRYPALETEFVLYCGGGYRSALAAWNLQKMGYTRVTSMDGGIKAWRAAGFPLELGTRNGA